MRGRAAVGALTAIGLAVPAPAAARSIRVYSEHGWVTAGDGVVVRRMDVKIDPAPDARDKRFHLLVTAPDGTTLVDRCARPTNPISLPYSGNGAYRMSMVVDDAKQPGCNAPVDRLDTSFDLEALSGFARPAPAFVYTHQSAPLWPVRVPGARTYQLVIDPPLPGRVLAGRPYGTQAIRFPRAGSYTVAYRAGISYPIRWTPLGAPATVRVLDRFLVRAPRLVDRRGPSYALSVGVEPARATGTVKVAIARRPGRVRWRSLGALPIGPDGGVRVRFRGRHARYALRFSYPGSETVAPGVRVVWVNLRYGTVGH